MIWDLVWFFFFDVAPVLHAASLFANSAERGTEKQMRKRREKVIQGFVSKLMLALAIVDVLVSCNRQLFSQN